jgi:C1A family cysteine protease
MFKQIVFALAVISLAAAFEPGHEKESFIFAKFQDFMKTHKKAYTTIEEFMARFKVFQSNYVKTERLALDTESPISHTAGITKFSDMTPQEFRQIYRNLKVDALTLHGNTSEELSIDLDVDVPESWDWRTNESAVGPVKDQGQCGSCWAFSTVGNLEGLVNLKNKSTKANFIQFSEQELVDCDTQEDQGCNGGLMEYAFTYLETHPLATEQQYPYKAEDGKCKVPKSGSPLVASYVLKKNLDEKQMAALLYQTGPLAIALNADPLQTYQKGVIDLSHSACDPEALDHGVTLVGYGHDQKSGKDYWIVKNSWGENWGEDGYFRIARGKATCGVNAYVSTAVLK